MRLGGVARTLALPFAALVTTGLCALAIGENPFAVMRALIVGGLGSPEDASFTLFYATDYTFAGLAVAVAYRAGLFNIGVEGQGLVAGVGVALAALASDRAPSGLPLVAGALGAVVFGAAWAAIPGWLQARRGAHVVITTIMFNFLASALLSWLLVEPLRAPGSMQPETRGFPEGARLLRLDDALAALHLPTTGSPLNASLLLALVAVVATHIAIFRTRWGFEARVRGANELAAISAGVSASRVVVSVMALSGALAGGIAINDLLGEQNRLILDFSGGAGFVGIAVALMAGARPLAVPFAALLFGFLTQGGAELAFEFPRVSRDLVLAAQGLVVLAVGAFARR